MHGMRSHTSALFMIYVFTVKMPVTAKKPDRATAALVSYG